MSASMRIDATSDPATPADARRDLQGYVERELDELVHEKIRAEEERRFRQLKWIVAFIGVIGLGTFGTLANYFIEKAVDARAGHVRAIVEISAINLLALKLEVNDSFTKEDADATMSLLRRVAKDEELRQSREFPATLTSVVRAFAAANLGPQIDELFRLFEDQLLEVPTVVQALLHHYGKELVTVAELHRDAVPAEVTAVQNFERLERAAASSDVPEVALYYRTLYESARSDDKTPLVAQLVERLRDLKSADLRNYGRQLIMHSRVENWAKERTIQAGAMERVTARFLQQYSTELARELGIPEAEVERWSAEPTGEDEVDSILALISPREGS